MTALLIGYADVPPTHGTSPSNSIDLPHWVSRQTGSSSIMDLTRNRSWKYWLWDMHQPVEDIRRR